MSEKKIWLAGAKGAGKTKLLEALEEKDYKVFPNEITPAWALDRLADYRTELDLATSRTDYPSSAGIFEDSLIDSVAYAATRISYIINDGIGTEDDLARWEIVLHAAGRMLRDSELPYAVIYVPGHEDHDFYEKLEEGLVATIFEFLPDSVVKYKLNETEALPRVEEAAKILEEVNGQESTQEESDGEDQ